MYFLVLLLVSLVSASTQPRTKPWPVAVVPATYPASKGSMANSVREFGQASVNLLEEFIIRGTHEQLMFQKFYGDAYLDEIKANYNKLAEWAALSRYQWIDLAGPVIAKVMDDMIHDRVTASVQVVDKLKLYTDPTDLGSLYMEYRDALVYALTVSEIEGPQRTQAECSLQ